MSVLNPVLSSIERLDQAATPATAGLTGALDRFLREVERRALRMAELSTGQREDALELVQDAMLVFVRSYGAKNPAEWAPLFYRVLDSRILDFHRRSTVRRRWRIWLGQGSAAADDNAEIDPMAQFADAHDAGPAQYVADGETRAALDIALKALPLRQRQAFLLRVWEGLDVAQTATAMACSEGSVKTHLSRAMHAMRTRLEDVR
jgi:RNA polymerase sigma-70 factor (ECF subfamily)